MNSLLLYYSPCLTAIKLVTKLEDTCDIWLNKFLTWVLASSTVCMQSFKGTEWRIIRLHMLVYTDTGFIEEEKKV